MEKTCPHCGAALPAEASFCPYCAKSVNRRSKPKYPLHIPVKFLRAALLLILALLFVAGAWLLNRPKTYDGMGEVRYTDPDGSYQLLLSSELDRYRPMSELEQFAGNEESYRFPLRLYVNHAETGADAGGIFLQKVTSAQISVSQPDGSQSPIQCSAPEPMDFDPNAALISLVDFTRDSASPAQIVWTLHMENGDTIHLRMDLTVTPTNIYNYDPENADLSDSQALQDLIDRAAQETSLEDTVNISLPAVTYTEPIILHSRSFNLTGTEENGRRTTFTAGIQVRDELYWISYFTGIEFVGDGTGVGLSTAGRAWAKDCRFANWKTAVLGYGNVWVNTTDCQFESNETGLHYNAADSGATDSRFTGNTFTGNATAVLLENVPTDLTMDFTDSVFTDNKIDIDNRCHQPVDISKAVFQ